ncbi:hypothetical protein EQM14_03085 [Caproiciproducens sp. NJN-50]|uniref:CoA-transferase n=1 Tax=Acutalibacteraceae TaxID=3082771 RepID=UPI000FFE10B6|nr:MULTISPECIES: CoA-transferase [Acutalibacteraceae]QAT48833.1 hypothetical protein EQM14_03085 [Caproiciproducens sp. NJN-50]
MAKIVSVEEAVSHVKSGDTVAVNGMMWVGGSKKFYEALENRFLETKSPTDLTLFSSCGIGHTMASGTTPELANRLAHPGMVKRIVTSHIQSFVDFLPMISNNQIEAYIIPQGTIAEMFHSAARRSAGTFTKIGLKTHADPRYQCGALNEISKDKLCELVTFDGEEYLFYRNIYPDVCLIRGTTADANGNITFEHEAAIYDPFATVQAVKNNGGIVIVQVERINGGFASPQLVKIPGRLVDYVYVDPDQMQTANVVYNGIYSGEIRAPLNAIDSSITEDTKSASDRPPAVRVITRRAAMELKKGDIVNLGIGMASSIGLDAQEMNLIDLNDITFTIELGLFGGVPAGSASFGATLNPDAMYDQASQFEFYEGGGLDIAFVGALEVDRHGNVNVIQSGKKAIGVGGFNYVTATPKTVVYCTKFMSRSNYSKGEDGRFVPVNGGFKKIVGEVEYINFNGEIATKNHQRALYITERCVFELLDGELVLTEISPFVDLQKDILDLLPFRPKISEHLKKMPNLCFEF